MTAKDTTTTGPGATRGWAFVGEGMMDAIIRHAGRFHRHTVFFCENDDGSVEYTVDREWFGGWIHFAYSRTLSGIEARETYHRWTNRGYKRVPAFRSVSRP